MFRNGLIFRIIGVVVLVGLIAGGIFMAFRAGEAQGISQSPAVATAIVQSAESGQPVPVPPMMYGHGYGYGYPMYGHHMDSFPFGAFCGSIFFLFLILRLDEADLLPRHASPRMGRSQAWTLGQALGERRPAHVQRMAQTGSRRKA